MSTRRIYLDSASTTPVAEEVVRAMAEAQRRFPGNPASQHTSGRAARAALEDSREELAERVGADLAAGDRLIFTSGGTEANNLALFGMAGEQPCNILVSAIEHPSVDAAADELARRGWSVERLPVDASGLVNLDEFRELLQQPTRLVSVIHGNNETGVLQPISEIAEIAHAAGAAVCADSVQVVGHVNVDFQSLGVDAMTMSAHKFHGPGSVGAVVLSRRVRLHPRQFGGHQQEGLRPGTEALAPAIGMLGALRLCQTDADAEFERIAQVQRAFEGELHRRLLNLEVHSAAAPRLPHISNVAFPGINRQELLLALDQAGIECSAGSACASGSTDASPTLVAMGCNSAQLEGSLRFSFGRGVTQDDVVEAAERISLIANKLRLKKPG